MKVSKILFKLNQQDYNILLTPFLLAPLLLHIITIQTNSIKAVE